MRKPVQGEVVRVQAEGVRPVEVEWRGRRFAVRPIDAMWCIEGRWWLDGERVGAKRRYFRLHLQNLSLGEQTLCVEVTRSHTGQWRLWRVAD